MKITKSTLKQIIKEEIEEMSVMPQDPVDPKALKIEALEAALYLIDGLLEDRGVNYFHKQRAERTKQKIQTALALEQS